MSQRTLRIAQLLVRLAARPARVEFLVNKYPPLTWEQIRDMATVDPTGDKGRYLEWVVRRTKDGNIRWPEDKDRVKRALMGYEEIRKKPGEMERYQVYPNIGRYTLEEVEGINRGVYGKGDRIGVGGSYLIYDDSGIQIVRAGGVGTDLEKAIETVCSFGLRTEWCTGDSATAKSYLQEGPLYLVYENGKPFGQLHVKRGEFQNTLSQVVDLFGHRNIAIALWNSSIPELGFSFYRILEMAEEPKVGERLDDSLVREKQALTNRFAVSPYALYIKRGRWAEGESRLLQIQGSHQLRAALDYVRQVLRKRWVELEGKMLDMVRSFQVGSDDQYEFDSILSLVISYCVSFIQGRWVEFEHIVVERVKMGKISIGLEWERYERAFDISWVSLVRGG